jgi:hypothetical protein
MSVVNTTHPSVVKSIYSCGVDGESGEHCARLISQPKASLHGREPSDNPR